MKVEQNTAAGINTQLPEQPLSPLFSIWARNTVPGNS